MRSIHLAIALAASASSFIAAESLSPRGEQALSQPLSLKSVQESDDMTLVQTFVLGDPHATRLTTVNVYKSKSANISLAKRDSQPDPQKDSKQGIPGKTKPLDLTPSECTSTVCYSGSYEPPSKTDCDAIVKAQLYDSTGSLRIEPGMMVLVYTGTCAVVFQHPVGKPESNLTFEYNWAQLGNIILGIQKKCDKPQDLSIGGACKIEHYLKYNFENVVISVQRYIAPSKPARTS